MTMHATRLELPRELVEQFTFPSVRNGRHWVPDTGTVEHLDYVPTGRSPKYRPVHWHDWMREQTRPWKVTGLKENGNPAALKTKPGPDTYQVERIAA